MLKKEEIEILNTNDWIKGIMIITKYWNIEYGTYEYKDIEGMKSIKLTTGGWSENEELIDEIATTMFWILWWQESKRGGYYKFVKESV